MASQRHVLTLLCCVAIGLPAPGWTASAQETYALWGDPQKGRQVYAERGCTSSTSRAILWAEVMWGHAVNMEEKMREMGLEWPTFADNEMVDLITYLRQATVAPPR